MLRMLTGTARGGTCGCIVTTSPHVTTPHHTPQHAAPGEYKALRRGYTTTPWRQLRRERAEYNIKPQLKTVMCAASTQALVRLAAGRGHAPFTPHLLTRGRERSIPTPRRPRRGSDPRTWPAFRSAHRHAPRPPATRCYKPPDANVLYIRLANSHLVFGDGNSPPHLASSGVCVRAPRRPTPRPLLVPPPPPRSAPCPRSAPLPCLRSRIWVSRGRGKDRTFSCSNSTFFLVLWLFIPLLSIPFFSR